MERDRISRSREPIVIHHQEHNEAFIWFLQAASKIHAQPDASLACLRGAGNSAADDKDRSPGGTPAMTVPKQRVY